MPFDKATKVLFNRVFSASGGTKVTYNRASGGTLTLDAIIGSTEFAQGNSLVGETFLLRSHDFIFRYSDLGFEPERGDSIVHGGVTYTVMIESGSAMFKFCDYSRQNIRVHTKELGT
jgi:hypothetical protein